MFAVQNVCTPECVAENKEPKTPLSDPLMLNEEHLNFSYLHLCNNINSNIQWDLRRFPKQWAHIGPGQSNPRRTLV